MKCAFCGKRITNKRPIHFYMGDRSKNIEASVGFVTICPECCDKIRDALDSIREEEG